MSAFRDFFRRGLDKESFLLWSVLSTWYLCGVTMVMQNDSWWHLRTGMEIWQRRAIPTTEIFSWAVPPGTPWPNHEWLSQVVLYALYETAGLPLVNFLGALLVTATGILVATVMKGPKRLRAVILLLMIPWLYTAFTVRPQLFSLFFLALLFWLLKKKLFAWLPALFLVWVQFHAGVVFGGASLLVATAAAGIFHRQIFRSLLLMTALSGLAVAVNPMGISIYFFPFESVSRAKELPLGEWQPPGFSGLMDRYFWLAAGVLLILCLVRLRARFLKCSESSDGAESDWLTWSFAAMAIALLPLAAAHSRNVYMWSVPAAVAASYLWRHSHHETKTEGSPRVYFGAALTLWALTVGLGALFTLNPIGSLRWTPVTEDGIKKLKSLPEPIFTTYDCGGYLLWFAPEKKVFIDSRQDPYPLPLLKEAIAVQASGDFRELFERFNIQSAIVERSMPLARALYRGGWKITYAGPAFLVFEK